MMLGSARVAEPKHDSARSAVSVQTLQLASSSSGCMLLCCGALHVRVPQMMGGRLERSVDEVSELVTSRPAWMVSGDPSTFNEEQLKEYKEYMAREAAAIEERLKRKGIMVGVASSVL